MSASMRRMERNVTDIEKIKACLNESASLKVGFYDEGEIFIVPVNFGYTVEGEKYTLYFHGAAAGRKAELAKAKPAVGFECDCRNETIHADIACKHTEMYLSIIGNGKISIIEDDTEKRAGLNAVMLKASGRGDWQFPDEMLVRTNVYKIDVTNLSCKEHC